MKHLLHIIFTIGMLAGLAVAFANAFDQEFADQPVPLNVEIPAR